MKLKWEQTAEGIPMKECHPVEKGIHVPLNSALVPALRENHSTVCSQVELPNPWVPRKAQILCWWSCFWSFFFFASKFLGGSRQNRLYLLLPPKPPVLRVDWRNSWCGIILPSVSHLDPVEVPGSCVYHLGSFFVGWELIVRPEPGIFLACQGLAALPVNFCPYSLAFQAYSCIF